MKSPTRHRENPTKEDWEEAVAGEGWAINDYTQMLVSSTPEEKAVIEHIIKEEKEHLSEILELRGCKQNPEPMQVRFYVENGSFMFKSSDESVVDEDDFDSIVMRDSRPRNIVLTWNQILSDVPFNEGYLDDVKAMVESAGYRAVVNRTIKTVSAVLAQTPIMLTVDFYVQEEEWWYQLADGTSYSSERFEDVLNDYHPMEIVVVWNQTMSDDAYRQDRMTATVAFLEVHGYTATFDEANRIVRGRKNPTTTPTPTPTETGENVNYYFVDGEARFGISGRTGLYNHADLLIYIRHNLPRYLMVRYDAENSEEPVTDKLFILARELQNIGYSTNVHDDVSVVTAEIPATPVTTTVTDTPTTPTPTAVTPLVVNVRFFVEESHYRYSVSEQVSMGADTFTSIVLHDQHPRNIVITWNEELTDEPLVPLHLNVTKSLLERAGYSVTIDPIGIVIGRLPTPTTPTTPDTRAGFPDTLYVDFYMRDDEETGESDFFSSNLWGNDLDGSQFLEYVREHHPPRMVIHWSPREVTYNHRYMNFSDLVDFGYRVENAVDTDTGRVDVIATLTTPHTPPPTIPPATPTTPTTPTPTTTPSQVTPVYRFTIQNDYWHFLGIAGGTNEYSRRGVFINAIRDTLPQNFVIIWSEGTSQLPFSSERMFDLKATIEHLGYTVELTRDNQKLTATRAPPIESSRDARAMRVDTREFNYNSMVGTWISRGEEAYPFRNSYDTTRDLITDVNDYQPQRLRVYWDTAVPFESSTWSIMLRVFADELPNYDVSLADRLTIVATRRGRTPTPAPAPSAETPRTAGVEFDFKLNHEYDWILTGRGNVSPFQQGYRENTEVLVSDMRTYLPQRLTIYWDALGSSMPFDVSRMERIKRKIQTLAIYEVSLIDNGETLVAQRHDIDTSRSTLAPTSTIPPEPAPLPYIPFEVTTETESRITNDTFMPVIRQLVYVLSTHQENFDTLVGRHQSILRYILSSDVTDGDIRTSASGRYLYIGTSSDVVAKLEKVSLNYLSTSRSRIALVLSMPTLVGTSPTTESTTPKNSLLKYWRYIRDEVARKAGYTRLQDIHVPPIVTRTIATFAVGDRVVKARRYSLVKDLYHGGELEIGSLGTVHQVRDPLSHIVVDLDGGRGRISFHPYELDKIPPPSKQLKRWEVMDEKNKKRVLAFLGYPIDNLVIYAFTAEKRNEILSFLKEWGTLPWGRERRTRSLGARRSVDRDRSGLSDEDNILTDVHELTKLMKTIHGGNLRDSSRNYGSVLNNFADSGNIHEASLLIRDDGEVFVQISNDNDPAGELDAMALRYVGYTSRNEYIDRAHLGRGLTGTSPQGTIQQVAEYWKELYRRVRDKFEAEGHGDDLGELFGESNPYVLPYHKVFRGQFDNVTTQLLKDYVEKDRPWKGTSEEQFAKLDTFLGKLSEIYKLKKPTLIIDPAMTGKVKDGVYEPKDNTIKLPKISVTTLLHEFRHALQHHFRKDVLYPLVEWAMEEDARSWSLSLWYQAMPEKFRKLVKTGKIIHMRKSDLEERR